MSKILIAYMTKTGTTREVAEEIARIAGDKGIIPDVLPLSAVESPGGYDAVLIGAPINGMQWLPEASDFVEKHKEALKKIPTAYFFVSYLVNSGCGFWRKIIRKSLDKVSETVKPVKVGMFDGRVEKAFPAFARFLFGLKKDIPLDLRDWDAIRAWGEEYITEISK
jgi:menaquinone-dependent protoporphyrinogen oxidase